jgi:flagellar L-ring protein FlgH
MKHRYAAALALISAFATACPVCAQGAQGPNTSFFGSLFTTPVATRVGDIVTVVIVETTQASTQVTQNHQRDTKSTVGPGTGLLDFIPLFGYTGSSQSGAQTNAARQESLTTRVSAKVVEVLPGGNLRIEGERQIMVNKDLQKLTIRGEVRARDVRSDNSIRSQDLVNAQILYTGADPIKPGKKVGIVTRLLNMLF